MDDITIWEIITNRRINPGNDLLTLNDAEIVSIFIPFDILLASLKRDSITRQTFLRCFQGLFLNVADCLGYKGILYPHHFRLLVTTKIDSCVRLACACAC